MGLMNVGRGEGAQIIQLFGRGVRLKGCGMSLKRSARAELAEGLERPDSIESLETLQVFGIRANYMAQFRDFLEEEGLSDDERSEFHLPIVRNLGTQPLKTIRIRKTINGVSTESGDAFRKLGTHADPAATGRSAGRRCEGAGSGLSPAESGGPQLVSEDPGHGSGGSGR